MTDTQWLCIRSFLKTCSGLYVGNEECGRRFVEVLYGMTESGAP